MEGGDDEGLKKKLFSLNSCSFILHPDTFSIELRCG